MGLAESRNIGMAAACGEYIAFLDADDVWVPDKLLRQYDLIKLTKCDICYSSYCFIDEKSNIIGRPFIVNNSVDFKELLYGNIIAPTTCEITREVAKNFRMSRQFQNEDFVYWLTILRAGYSAAGVTDVLAQYRLTSAQSSANKLHMTKVRWDMYRKFLSYGIFRSAWYTAIGSVRAAVKYMGVK